MIFSYLEGLLQIGLAMGFGYGLGLVDLLERESYRWFPKAGVVVGAGAGLLGLAMLMLSLDSVHAFWLASLGAWTLFGRMFSPGKLIVMGLMGGYLAWWGVSADNVDLPILACFCVGLPALTGARLLLARSKKSPAWLASLAERESSAAYLLVVLYLAFVELDLALAGVVWAFFSGGATVRNEAHLTKLRSWGVKKR